MKSTGIVRQVDKLDRIVIPKELCRTMDISAKSPLEIFIENSRIVLKKHIQTEISASNKNSIGIVRKIDDMDRIVIPKEICKITGIKPKTYLEIFTEDNKILLGKYESSFACIFCGEVNAVAPFKGKVICSDCLKELSKLSKK